MELSLPGTDDAILRAARHVVELAGELGFPEERRNEIQTAVVEALTNAAIHGNENHATPVRLTAEIDGDSLRVEIVDAGSGLSEIPPLPDLERKLEGLDPPQGWGIYLMRSFASEIDYALDPERGHIVKLKFDEESPGALVEPRIERNAHA